MWLLHEKCSYSELFWSVFSRIWTEYGPENLQIQKLFTQWIFWHFRKKNIHHIGSNFIINGSNFIISFALQIRLFDTTITSEKMQLPWWKMAFYKQILS